MKILQQVENIMRAVSKTRSSDKELYIVFMQKSGMELSDRQIEVFKRMPSLETVRRSRQLIQEQGKYPPTAEVEKERYEKFKRIREGGEPEEVIEKLNLNELPWGNT